MSSAARLFLVDDDDAIRLSLRLYFGSKGFHVTDCASLASARSALERETFDVAVVDFHLGDGSALEVLERCKQRLPEMPVLVLTGKASISSAVASMRAGAVDFVEKPIALPELHDRVRGALESSRHLLRRALRESGPMRVASGVNPFLGTSRAIRELEAMARRVLNARTPVLLTGETGTGKGVLAAWIHAHSARAEGQFVSINCAGLGRELLENELFGHDRGAFTGALTAKVGLLEVADHGTLFLDELAEMDLGIQARLLTVLEEKRFRRLGDVRERSADFRLIAATNADLEERAARGTFRADLLYRISAVTLRVPSLRDRAEDLGDLVEHLLARLRAETHRPGLRITEEALAALRQHPWPGNIRELRNTLERAVLLDDDDALQPDSFALQSADPHEETPVELGSLEQLTQHHVAQALTQEKGNVGRAAARLGISRTTLYAVAKRAGLSLSKFRTPSGG